MIYDETSSISILVYVYNEPKRNTTGTMVYVNQTIPHFLPNHPMLANEAVMPENRISDP